MSGMSPSMYAQMLSMIDPPMSHPYCAAMADGLRSNNRRGDLTSAYPVWRWIDRDTVPQAHRHDSMSLVTAEARLHRTFDHDDALVSLVCSCFIDLLILPVLTKLELQRENYADNERR